MYWWIIILIILHFIISLILYGVCFSIITHNRGFKDWYLEEMKDTDCGICYLAYIWEIAIPVLLIIKIIKWIKKESYIITENILNNLEN